MSAQIGLIAQQRAASQGERSRRSKVAGHRREVPVVDDVGRRLGIGDSNQATEVVVAVVQSLLGCLSLVDGAQFEVLLPGRVRRRLRHDHPILGISFQPAGRFLAELAERNRIDLPTAGTWTRAVCAALAAELPSGVMSRVRAQVPGLVRAFFPAGERVAPPLPERAHRCQESPPLWSEIARPVPSYLMFAPGDPITGRATEGSALGDRRRRSARVLPEETHVPTHAPVAPARRDPV